VFLSRHSAFIFSILISSTVSGQQWSLDGQWKEMGPDSIPGSQDDGGAVGTGPLEFIRVYQRESGHLLAGSLNGGLFYSENGGEKWTNAGSDNWDYSGCAWADFYPEDRKIWFAVSNVTGANGKPGDIGKDGGILRSRDGGKSWTNIGNYQDFENDPFTAIYGTRFQPDKSSRMYALTQNGLFFTDNCLAGIMYWERVIGINGWVYDLDFISDKMFLTNFRDGKWCLLEAPIGAPEKFKKVDFPAELEQKKRTVTIEPIGEKLLVFLDFETGADHMWDFDPQTGEWRELLTNQNVSFGSGHTLSVNPHNESEVICGYGTNVRMYSWPQMQNIKLGKGFHVDIEFVAFDPFDSLTFYLGTHGGVYVTRDGGVTFDDLSNGLGLAEVMGMDVSMTNPEQIAIGCFHDGSTLRTNWQGDERYYWRNVNGGDGLTALIDPTDDSVVYTSNQFVAGGIYVSKDKGEKNQNLHNLNGLKTSGWEMTAVLHPTSVNLIFFNFMHNTAEHKNNIDAARISNAEIKGSAEVVSDFYSTHQMKSYKVYGLFNSPFHPDLLYAYVLHYDKDAAGAETTRHRIFVNANSRDSASRMIRGWAELELPYNAWIGDVETDPDDRNVIYLSYTSGKDLQETIYGDKGLIYALRYKPGTGRLKREIDISRNIPNSVAGRFNLEAIGKDHCTLIFGTRTGVYVGSGKILKGKGRWKKVGSGMPHCKVFGVHYHEGKQLITVGMMGRGVWRYSLIGG